MLIELVLHLLVGTAHGFCPKVAVLNVWVVTPVGVEPQGVHRDA